jgi:hypothetical protein
MRFVSVRKHYMRSRRPGMDCRDPVDMDVSGRILRVWMPAIHAGMTEAADGKCR